jgi:hypothetical protein
MIERMLADYRSAYGFGAFCLRYFNAAGADARLRENETHLIPRAVMALQRLAGRFGHRSRGTSIPGEQIPTQLLLAELVLGATLILSTRDWHASAPHETYAAQGAVD